jgi:hypothetical protein
MTKSPKKAAKKKTKEVKVSQFSLPGLPFPEPFWDLGSSNSHYYIQPMSIDQDPKNPLAMGK